MPPWSSDTVAVAASTHGNTLIGAPLPGHAARLVVAMLAMSTATTATEILVCHLMRAPPAECLAGYYATRARRYRDYLTEWRNRNARSGSLPPEQRQRREEP